MILDEFLNLIINIFIVFAFCYMSLFNYFSLVFFGNSIGFYGILLDYEIFLSDFCAILLKGFVMPVFLYYILICLWILFWIFIFWMIIIIFVPFVFIVPLPFIPFIIPIPLKLPMLEFIPPFKVLTDRGILPLMRDIVFNFIFSESNIRDRFRRPFVKTYGFLFEEVKKIFGDFFKLYMNEPEKQDISKGLQDDNYKVDIDDNRKEIKQQEKKLNANELKRQKVINIEEKSCRNNNAKFATIDMSKSEIMGNSIKNQKSNIKCQMKATRAYIDNLT